ncbi:MAG: hypothetical protein IPH69_14815 [Bacteroidales bacterium]|nr:hypothetical protein [Bacteroidales bacterium]
MKRLFLIFVSLSIIWLSCSRKAPDKSLLREEAHSDVEYIQDYSIKFYSEPENILIKAAADRNGYIQILSSHGLLRLNAGQFLYPGKLVKDSQYKPTSDKKVSGITVSDSQLVYVDNKSVFSNAWAGKLYMPHKLSDAKILTGGNDFDFLISDGRSLAYLRDSGEIWRGSLSGEEIVDIKFDDRNDFFWVLGKESINVFFTGKRIIENVLRDKSLTCIGLFNNKIVAGTTDGYIEIDTKTRKQVGKVNRKMPWTDLTAIAEIDKNLWFGSTHGAMKLREDGKFDYYASERWLLSDSVVHIAGGPGKSVLILTTSGLAQICFKNMTLSEKAEYYEWQVRNRHIRNGFNATVSGMQNGDLTSGSLEDSDNDGLWTSMYLAAEAFRYNVTGSQEALQNVRESLDAMERLYTINNIPGFPSRSFERRGYKYDDKAWQRAKDPEWDWKSTTSSDEAIGHIFAFGVIAELVDDAFLQNKAISLIDTLMSTILKNDFYLIDWDGKPTRWGRWNPDYVNSLHISVGDRKINSSNIIGMLQTAYHFTKKEKYREAAFELMNNHGYFENLMRPMKQIGTAPDSADEMSRMLSDGWNHSDDEMYYCGYWGLYRYAFNDTLKLKIREAIIDHWENERPEKEGLWNIMTALADVKVTDIKEAIWYLQQYPLDLIDWSVSNSYRKDIERIEPNFRNQTISEVLPPDELRISRHNSNRFDLDGNGGGTSEYSAGDIWLLPYWIGRYLGVISGPHFNGN